MSQTRDANHEQPHLPPQTHRHRSNTPSAIDHRQASLWAATPLDVLDSLVAASPQNTALADEDDAILFNGLHEAYGYCSNFAAYPITLDGVTWPTVEHYFQAQKFAGTEHEEAIRLARSPMVAARMGRSRQRPLRADWERVKDDVMYVAVRAKFAQHDELRRSLLATGAARIIEHRARDAYWGDGPDGSGKNMLGVLLMRARAEFRARPLAASAGASDDHGTREAPTTFPVVYEATQANGDAVQTDRGNASSDGHGGT